VGGRRHEATESRTRYAGKRLRQSRPRRRRRPHSARHPHRPRDRPTQRHPSGWGPLAGTFGVVLAFAYFVYLEATYGQTFGKKLLNLVVVYEDGGDCDYEAAVVRNLLRYIDWLPFFYLLGVVVMVISDDSQRLGDVVADTLVVRSK
jgi:uncharacterized RDD family membrane protein YckC